MTSTFLRHDMDQESLMRRAVELSRTSVERGGLPFGAVVALGGEIIGEAYNEVAATSDPTAHAEIVAIRRAAARRGHFKLEGFVLYASSEPCPMCLAAAHWARIEKIFYGNTIEVTAGIGFLDRQILEQITRPRDARLLRCEQLLAAEAASVCRQWLDAKKDLQ
jgi:guanine deaminase